MLNGFRDVIPEAALIAAEVDAASLELILCGVPELCVSTWRDHSDFPRNQTTQWFWECLQEFSADRRARILAYTTGTATVPAGGFEALQPCFKIVMNSNKSDMHIPEAHTCANQMVLPNYSSKAVLEAKLLQACEHGFGFGFA